MSPFFYTIVVVNDFFKHCWFVQAQRLQRELRAEHDLAQKELRAERDLFERELQESRRRLQQECEHRVALERDRVRLMEEERTRLLQQVQSGEQGLIRNYTILA